jgi:hypothetical protein
MTIGIAPSSAKAAPVVRFSAPGPSQSPFRGRHERGGLLMARHNQLDARPAKRLDDIEILFAGHAEDPLDAFVLQGRDQQVRTFHMPVS